MDEFVNIFMSYNKKQSNEESNRSEVSAVPSMVGNKS